MPHEWKSCANLISECLVCGNKLASTLNRECAVYGIVDRADKFYR